MLLKRLALPLPGLLILPVLVGPVAKLRKVAATHGSHANHALGKRVAGGKETPAQNMAGYNRKGSNSTDGIPDESPPGIGKLA